MDSKRSRKELSFWDRWAIMVLSCGKWGDDLVKDKALTQEGLKVIACVSMLLDHIGAILVPAMGLRMIGRMAFPVYCFLLSEGMAHTRNVKKYGIRLAAVALLAEVPFDLALFGGFNWMHQSVMVTLLLGFGMTLWIRRTRWSRLIPVLICAAAAELLRADYGAIGVMIVALFVMSRERTDRMTVQTLVLAALCWFMGSAGWQIGPVFVPVQMFAVLAMVPIGLYRGGKSTGSRAVQWGFCLFYPVHLLALWLIGRL